MVKLIHITSIGPIDLCMKFSIFFFFSKIVFLKKNFFSKISRLPWNQYTILGFMVEVFLIDSTIIAYLLIVPAILTFFVSICKWHEGFYEIFRTLIANVDSATGLHPLPSIRIKEMLHESIVFHTSAKE